MKRILYYSLVLLTAGNGMLQAQNWIHGKVVDKEERPVDGVAVVLQTLDSTYIDAVVTDSLGAFMLNKEAGPNYRLLFQHLLYEPVCKKISTADAGTISLTEKDYELEGVVVKAERPQVKVENGALKQSYGSLTMYYTPKEKCATYVDVKRSDGKGNDAKLYKYNSATSLFYISLSSSSSGSGTSYCTFATLEDDSVEVLDDLKAAITDYIEDEYEGNAAGLRSGDLYSPFPEELNRKLTGVIAAADFAPTSKVVVDEDDRYVGSDKESREYSVPLEPIVIKSVKVKSY